MPNKALAKCLASRGFVEETNVSLSAKIQQKFSYNISTFTEDNKFKTYMRRLAIQLVEPICQFPPKNQP